MNDVLKLPEFRVIVGCSKNEKSNTFEMDYDFALIQTKNI
jgi:hypothetical protein